MVPPPSRRSCPFSRNGRGVELDLRGGTFATRWLSLVRHAPAHAAAGMAYREIRVPFEAVVDREVHPGGPRSYPQRQHADAVAFAKDPRSLGGHFRFRGESRLSVRGESLKITGE